MNAFLLGATTFAYAIIALFFLKFRAQTRERLFTVFAIAFAILALNRLLLAFTELPEARTALYFVRFLAFGLIVFAVVDKNRARAVEPR